MSETTLSLREPRTHGTLRYPFSFHETYIPEGDSIKLYLHWHAELELLLVLEGGAIFHIENRDYVVKANEALFIHPQFLHSASSTQGMPCRFFALVFHSNIICDVPNSEFYYQFIYPIVSGELLFEEFYTGEIAWQKKLIDLVRSLREFFGQSPIQYELLLKSRLLEIWHLLFQHAYQSNSLRQSHSSRRLQAALDYIHEHYDQELVLSQLAERVHISVSQFCRNFQKEMGVSAFSYITRFRIIKSCSFLLETDKKITDLANESGFANISNFNRAFQKYIGCTPSEYRKMFR